MAIPLLEGLDVGGKTLTADALADPAQTRRLPPRSQAHYVFVVDYLDFPGVAQAFVIERYRLNKKSGHTLTEVVYGITSHSPQTTDPQTVLSFNRNHWNIENGCHYRLDWNWDADRCTIRKSHGPKNITALRRFAIGVILPKTKDIISSTIQRLARNIRLLFDYLRLSENSRRNLPQSLALPG